MGEYRRRRIEPDEPKSGGGLPIFPLIILVVFAGLLLGGGLAKFLGRGAPQATAAPTFTPLPTQAATQQPQAVATFKTTPTPTAIAKASPSATPKASPSPTPSASPAASNTPSPAPSARVSAKPAATPTLLLITPKPKPSLEPTAKPTPKATPKPTATPSPAPALITGAATADHAASIVRSYLTAMANGESSFATGYLRRGLPNEDFMKGGRVTSVQATSNGDGSFFVTAAMEAPGGSYTENFRVENGPNGLQITEHSPSVTH